MFQTKLHITTQQPIPGYIHIGPNEVSNLDFYVDNGECSEIVLEVLCHVPVQQTEVFLKNVIDKLEPKGKLVVIGLEPVNIFKAYLTKRLDIQAANFLIYGQPPFNKVSILPKDVVESLLNQNSVETEEVKYNNMEYVIIGRKS